jgi:hypothetical protein
MGDAFVTQPKPSFIALAIAAAGIPFYFIWRKKTMIAKRLHPDSVSL